MTARFQHASVTPTEDQSIRGSSYLAALRNSILSHGSRNTVSPGGRTSAKSLTRAAPPPSTARPFTQSRQRQRSTSRTLELAAPTTTRYKRGEKISTRCGIDDLEKWFDDLNFDPKRNTKQMRELIADERQRVVVAQQRVSHESMERRLHTLSSALRSDLEVFVHYLLDYGTHFAQGVTPVGDRSSFPTRDSYMLLRVLFNVLDTDQSGTLTFHELHHAAVLLGRLSYDKQAFAKLDSNRSGSIDFLEMLKAFYPHASMRALAKLQKEIERTLPANGCLTARDFMSPTAIKEVEQSFSRFASMPGGCTMDNMLKHSSPFLQERPEIIESVFRSYDTDKNHALDFEEFLEVAKFSYPPFAHAPPGGSRSGGGDAEDTIFSLRLLARKNIVDPRNARVAPLPTILPRAPETKAADPLDPSGRRRPGANGVSPRNQELLHRCTALRASLSPVMWSGSPAASSLGTVTATGWGWEEGSESATGGMHERQLLLQSAKSHDGDLGTSPLFPCAPHSRVEIEMDHFLPSATARDGGGAHWNRRRQSSSSRSVGPDHTCFSSLRFTAKNGV